MSEDVVNLFLVAEREKRARETYMAVASNGSLIPADAIVLLTGDGEARLRPAIDLLSLAKYIVVAGTLDNPPYSLSAATIAAKLIGLGVSPDRIIQYGPALNTKEEADSIVALAFAKGWTRLLLVTSPYHSYRALLTFVQSLKNAGQEEQIRVVLVPTGMYMKWGEKPEGLQQTRCELFVDELRRIEEYRAKGHVASAEDGLSYLHFWESRN